jgi:hypothetical protein
MAVNFHAAIVFVNKRSMMLCCVQQVVELARKSGEKYLEPVGVSIPEFEFSFSAAEDAVKSARILDIEAMLTTAIRSKKEETGKALTKLQMQEMITYDIKDADVQMHLLEKGKQLLGVTALSSASSSAKI